MDFLYGGCKVADLTKHRERDKKQVKTQKLIGVHFRAGPTDR